MTENDLQKVHNHHIYPGYSKLTSDKGPKKFDYGRRCGTHWTSFYIKGNKLFYFDSFGGKPDEFFLQHLPKPITFHNYKIQNINK